jgi:hypothetical protein
MIARRILIGGATAALLVATTISQASAASRGDRMEPNAGGSQISGTWQPNTARSQFSAGTRSEMGTNSPRSSPGTNARTVTSSRTGEISRGASSRVYDQDRGSSLRRTSDRRYGKSAYLGRSERPYVSNNGRTAYFDSYSRDRGYIARSGDVSHRYNTVGVSAGYAPSYGYYRHRYNTVGLGLGAGYYDYAPGYTYDVDDVGPYYDYAPGFTAAAYYDYAPGYSGAYYDYAPGFGVGVGYTPAYGGCTCAGW